MTNPISNSSVQPGDVLEAWLGTTDLQAAPDKTTQKSWFFSAPGQDEALATRFGHLPELAAGGDLDSWDSGTEGRLALILLCDQLPRNMYRGTARAFAYDPIALRLARDAITRRVHHEVGFFQRQFFILPLEHAEDLDVQDQCIEESRFLLESAPPELREDGERFLVYAEKHRDLINRFGRFPHRNLVLARAPTPEETVFLKEGGATFGQGG
jgi:uncharacterized protein (DUF924 family)